ncbi:MAG TPA: Uma2 family endonuclease [Woeseiaceae bacterium]|nr:Uma2 family endonuclease [Woeseiaceae bacterium]
MLMTVEDLYALPDDGLHYELVHGEFVSEPPPGGRHGRIAARLVQRIGAYAESHRLGVVLTCDTAFVLHREPDTVRAPDVAFVSHERYRAFGDDVLQPQITTEPGELNADDLLPGFRLPVSDIFDL